MESKESVHADGKGDALGARIERKEFCDHGREDGDEGGVDLHHQPVLSHKGEVGLQLAKKQEKRGAALDNTWRHC